MCTALSFNGYGHYFGRNLDLEYSYQEAVTVTPRNYPLSFRKKPVNHNHYAIIGMATIADGYPLYYDATNEHGLSMAALNFPGSAVYYTEIAAKDNIAPFEVIPWILSQCRNIGEARRVLDRINIVRVDFSDSFPVTPLHWMIADKDCSIVLETLAGGIQIYENPVGILTNSPPFDFHMQHLSNYLNLTSMEPTNRFSKDLPLNSYSRGMGAIGLPGDLSSSSRFVRCAFTKWNSPRSESEEDAVSQFFHILGSVAQPRGCVIADGKYEKTVYSSCCNTTSGTYYYTTYENSRITGISLISENLNDNKLISYPVRGIQDIYWENQRKDLCNAPSQR